MFLGSLFVLFPFPPLFCFPLPAFCSPPPCCVSLPHHFIVLVIHSASKELAGMGRVVLGAEAVPLLCLLVSRRLIRPIVPASP